ADGDRRGRPPRGRRGPRARRLRALSRREGRGVDGQGPGRARQDAVREEGLQRVPHHGWLAARRTELEGHVRHDGAAGRRHVGEDGRELHPRVDPVSPGHIAAWLPAVDALVRGPAQRERARGPDRVHQVAEVARATMATSMTNEDGYPDVPTTELDFLHVPKGIKSWMFSLDHKRIGMMY